MDQRVPAWRTVHERHHPRDRLSYDRGVGREHPQAPNVSRNGETAVGNGASVIDGGHVGPQDATNVSVKATPFHSKKNYDNGDDE